MNMTTIACNRKMMSGDTRYTDGGLEGKCKTKIHNVNGDLVGFAGSMAEGLAFVKWYKNKDEEKPEISDTTILVLKYDETIWTYDSNYHAVEVTDKDFYAIGSGSHFAMGAMSAGKNPTEAVRIATKLDVYSGLPVRTLKL
jgi:ATP-dependent protease HslVU (ClpYQ) peptidase subunit